MSDNIRQRVIDVMFRDPHKATAHREQLRRRPIRARRPCLQPRTKVVCNYGQRIWPRLWRIEWVQLCERSDYEVVDGKFVLKGKIT